MRTISTTFHTSPKAIGILMTLLCFCLSLPGFASNPEDNTYPTDKRLFHIARSLNKNLVCYDVNLENGKLDTKAPLTVYWVNREERPGETNGLNFFQRKMAYGYKLVEKDDDSCKVSLSAYPAKKLTICRNNNQYVCLTTIDNQPAILESLYVKAKEGNPLSVEYVELQGIALRTGVKLTEKVKK